MRYADDGTAIYVSEQEKEQVVSDLLSIFNNGLGENSIKDVARSLALDCPKLAEILWNEITYWGIHGDEDKGGLRSSQYDIQDKKDSGGAGEKETTY